MTWERVEISCPNAWGEGKAFAYWTLGTKYADGSYAYSHLNWKLERIYLSPSLMPHEKEIVETMAEAMHHHRQLYAMEEIASITVDCNHYTHDKSIAQGGKHLWDWREETLKDTETDIILKKEGGFLGKYAGQWGGVSVTLVSPEKWGTAEVTAHLFKKEHWFTDEQGQDKVDTHWELYRIYIPDSIIIQEQRIIEGFESLLLHCPVNNYPERWGKVTADFSHYIHDEELTVPRKYIFKRRAGTVTDTEHGIVLKCLSGSVGPDGERGGGERFEISWDRRWGSEKAIAHVFIKHEFLDENHVQLHWKLYRIYIPAALMSREQEVVFVLESCLRHYPSTFNPESLGGVTTDFSSYSKAKEFLLA